MVLVAQTPTAAAKDRINALQRISLGSSRCVDTGDRQIIGLPGSLPHQTRKNGGVQVGSLASWRDANLFLARAFLPTEAPSTCLVLEHHLEHCLYSLSAYTLWHL